MESAGPDAKRIMLDGKIMALAFRLATGSWRVFDTEGAAALQKGAYDTPRKAMKAWIAEAADPEDRRKGS